MKASLGDWYKLSYCDLILVIQDWSMAWQQFIMDIVFHSVFPVCIHVKGPVLYLNSVLLKRETNISVLLYIFDASAVEPSL